MRKLRIATRASRLAMTQSGHVKEMIEKICPECEISFEKVSTLGDRDQSDFLYKTETVGFFTSEVENFLLQKKAAASPYFEEAFIRTGFPIVGFVCTIIGIICIGLGIYALIMRAIG